MTLDLEIQQFIALSEAAFPPDFATLALEEQRLRYSELCRRFAGRRPQGLSVRDLDAPGPAGDIRLRLYRPEAVERPGVLLYFHGGGYVFGDLDSHDAVCADLAAGSAAAVLSLDYRLAPEHRFPAAVEDARAGLTWLLQTAADLGLDPRRIAVGGDSAGGNLAAGLCFWACAQDLAPLAGQLLIYPDLGLAFEDPQRCRTPDAPGLSRADMRHYHESWLGSATTGEPSAAPLLNRDYAGLPPTFVQAVQYDPLRDDAEVYAERLSAARVSVRLDLQPGLIHGYLRARGMSAAARRAFAVVVSALADTIGHSAVTSAR
ncbi:alpha/beta hydrolase [Algihabitans albus]|uniref:alpha/beta hydrolase n=1 Tax=Algihabitans albus TaxID=2164067 RepID=UPI000E5CB908|nr:alpha/beta hydrolase [Algihabitans albus]